CLGPGVRPRLRRRAEERRRAVRGREEPVRAAVGASAERRPGMTVLLYIIGIVLFLIGSSIPLGLHELGHLTPAKRFGVKVTHYMVGFGPTLFSFRRGETEYGVKAFPLGGFIAMPGMCPPEPATTQRLEGQTVGASEAGAREAEDREPEAGAGEAAVEPPVRDGLRRGGSQYA